MDWASCAAALLLPVFDKMAILLAFPDVRPDSVSPRPSEFGGMIYNTKPMITFEDKVVYWKRFRKEVLSTKTIAVHLALNR